LEIDAVIGVRWAIVVAHDRVAQKRGATSGRQGKRHRVGGPGPTFGGHGVG
jgi:hypothetical protein